VSLAGQPRDGFVLALLTRSRRSLSSSVGYRRTDEATGVEYIRANQGHSIKQVLSEDALQPVTSAEQVPVCVHGTKLALWDKIFASGGLNRMGKSPCIRCAAATVPGKKKQFKTSDG